MKRRDGFTLIELLVVIAIISLLLGILIPALSGARERAKSVYCRTKLGELSKAAFQYTSDWDVYPPCLDNYSASGLNTNRPGLDWLGIGDQQAGAFNPGDPLDPGTGNPKGFSAAPRHGLLYKYFYNDDLIKCPSDYAGEYEPGQMVSAGNGKFSYSMLAGMGLRQPGKVPIARNRAGDHVQTISEIPLFVEEHPDGSNNDHKEGNCWNVDTFISRHRPTTPRKGRRPGQGNVTVFAQGEMNVGFADGHAEGVKTNFGMTDVDMMMPGNEDVIGNNVKGVLNKFGVRTWDAGQTHWQFLARIN